MNEALPLPEDSGQGPFADGPGDPALAAFSAQELMAIAVRLRSGPALHAAARHLALAARVQAAAAPADPAPFVPREVRPKMSREEWIATYARGAS